MNKLTHEEMEDFAKNKRGSRELPPCGVVPFPHSSQFFTTGDWRGNRGYPVLDPEKCTSCLRCYFVCPDDAIRMVEQEKEGKMRKMPQFNLNYCKGCGVCANECPDRAKAITMTEEEIA